jgi:PAS domain S-box-containing protein
VPLPDQRVLNDPARLDALRACDLLDTDVDERYDRLTRLVARAVGAPVAAFTLVDDTRQFWKSLSGDVPARWAAERGTPLSHSFCAHVVASGAPLVVCDARVDPRVSDNPAISDLHVIAYAGVPVRTPGGAVVGSFSVMDGVPRRWSAAELTLLEQLGTCLESELELHLEIAERRRAERTLAETSARLQALVDFTPALLQIASLDGRLLFVNHAWRALLAYDEDELAPLRVSDVIVPELRAEYLERIDAALRGEAEPPFDTVLLSRTGRRTGAKALVRARLDGGVPVAVHARFEDVTDLRRGEEAASRMVATLNATTDIVVILDGRGQVTYLNRAGRRMLGISETESVRGIQWRSMYTRATRKLLLQVALPSAVRDGVWEGETRLVSRAGREIPVSQVVIAHRSPRGGVWYVSTIMRDISDQKRKEQEFGLLQWMTEAIAEAGDLGMAFHIALDRLCQLTGWRYGEVWVPEGEELARAAVWHSGDAGLPALAAAWADETCRRGEGLPGVAWQTERPTWVRDMTSDTVFHHREPALAAGLKAAVAVPVFSRGELVAVMQFVMAALPDEEEYPVQLVSLVASQLGGVMRRKRADADIRESEDRFRRLSDASNDGVAVTRGGKVLITNAAWTRMFGYTAEEAAGMEATRLVPAADRERQMRRMRVIKQESYSIIAVRKNGTTFEGEVTVQPVLWEGLPARVSVIRDVTEERRVSRMKSEFVSTVSHELRTPLTSVRGALGLLEAGVAGPISPQGLDLIRIARENAERLIRLISDMLDLDKIEAGKFNLRRASLMPSDVVRVAVDGISGMAGQFEVRLAEHIDAHRSFAGDHDRVVQVLTNLLSNAIKFSPKGSTVEVAVTETADEAMRFEVTNEGAGISAADRSRLFQKFEQLDASDTRRHGGTGLGLAISKAIVDQHGGRIGVDSEPNGRTRFWFELPLRRGGNRESGIGNRVAP